VVQTKALPTLMHTQNNIHTICITEYYVHIAYKHIYAYVYKPALEATALTRVHGLAMGLVIAVRQAV